MDNMMGEGGKCVVGKANLKAFLVSGCTLKCKFSTTVCRKKLLPSLLLSEMTAICLA